MDIIQKNPIPAAIVSLVIGFVVGLFVFGWWLTPVQWQITGPDQFADEACRTAASPANANNIEAQTQYDAAARAINGQGCGDLGQWGTADAGGSPVVFLLLILAIVVLALLILMRRRNALPDEAAMADSQPAYTEVPDAGPVGVDLEEDTIPIARFRTNYAFGHDTYDDSFSIESGAADFLGECGVTVAESLGTETPKNVTAFEVWLFDKNDIRTLTKVIMSDHAFFDDAIKAKLAPKGEPVLARQGETVVLETASLIINAQITEMEYGEGSTLPPESFFERFTIELSAWAKDGDFEPPDLEDRVDELLNY